MVVHLKNGIKIYPIKYIMQFKRYGKVCEEYSTNKQKY